MTEPSLHHITCPAPYDSRRMAWWQWGDPAAPHLVICVHGLARQARDFDALAAALLARAHQHGQRLRVVCPDVAGRGESDWLPEPAAYVVPTYAVDMLALLGALHQTAPVATLDWVGTSMGGLIGLTLAGTPALPLPVPVRRLVLNDVGPRIEWAALARIGQYLGHTGPFATLEEGLATLRENASAFGPHTDAQWHALTRPMLRPLPDGRWRLHYDPAIAAAFHTVTPQAIAQGEAALWQLYDQTTARVLLLRGAESDLLSPATAQAMTERGPRAQLRTFAHVGHAPSLMAQDQLDTVLGFLLPPADAMEGHA
ncbi:MAG: alpha/beta hydrolase [Pseudomonadota bacterium]|nr:alpha/beta hydrolase [Pseudomonadota bacterium]